MRERSSKSVSIPIAELVILPFENTPRAVVQMLAGELCARGVATRVDAPVPLPIAAYDRARSQYRAEPLLALASGHGARHVLALTQRDLFADGFNFVFGIASPRGARVVSVARLLASDDHALFCAHVIKGGDSRARPYARPPALLRYALRDALLELPRRYLPQRRRLLQALRNSA